MASNGSSTAARPGGLVELLRALTDAGDGAERVSISDLVAAVGQRSFGALLLVPSLLIVSPLSGIPGVPTVAATVIVLICGQYLIGSDQIWLPRWLRRLSITRRRFTAAVEAVTPVARVMDRVFFPRLTFLINKITFVLVAVVCALLAMTMPPLEVLPFTSSATAFVIALFAMALLARDGLLASIALGLTGGALVLFCTVVLPSLVRIYS